MPTMMVYLSPADEQWLVNYANKHNMDACTLAENVISEAILDIKRRNGELVKEKK